MKNKSQVTSTRVSILTSTWCNWGDIRVKTVDFGTEITLTVLKMVRSSKKSHGMSGLWSLLRKNFIWIFCVTFWGSILLGGFKNRVKSGVRRTTHSERTVLAMENLIRYSERRRNFRKRQFEIDFRLLNVFRVKFTVESNEFADFAEFTSLLYGIGRTVKGK